MTYTNTGSRVLRRSERLPRRPSDRTKLNFPSAQAKVDWFRDYHQGPAGRSTGKRTASGRKRHLRLPRNSGVEKTLVTLTQSGLDAIQLHCEAVLAETGREPTTSLTISVALELLAERLRTNGGKS